MEVYVLNKDGKALMPTNPAKARILLKEGIAKVVHRKPFTIQLLYETPTHTKPMSLGVDPGSGTFSCSVRIDNTNEIVYSSEVTVRNDITERMKRRKMYRVNRRARKTRYRQARFLNRKSQRELNPTIQSKLQSHEKEIEFIKSILPITTVIVEKNKFDNHKLKNSNIKNYEYSKGDLYGYENSREYVLDRDNHTCVYCKTKSTKKNPIKLETHHVIPRSKRGSDSHTNLLTLCTKCHKGIHKGNVKLTKKHLKNLTKVNQKAATQTNIIVKRLLEWLENSELTVRTTYGYLTKVKRHHFSLKKEHFNDSICISFNIKNFSSYDELCFDIKNLYTKVSKPKGNYQLTKGVRSEQKIPSGKICDFRTFDKVKYRGGVYFIKGKMSTGYGILSDIYGTKVSFESTEKFGKTVKLNDLTLVSRASTCLVM